MKNNSVILITVLIILTLASLGVATYTTYTLSKYTETKPDYRRQIDSLGALIILNTNKVTALDSATRAEQLKIKQLELSLLDLSDRTDENLERYEEELDRLNRLTDSQLVIKFTDIFDYD